MAQLQTTAITGSLTVTGDITAQTLVVQTITSSQSWITGSTKFGSINSNTHQFTGSVSISGSSTFGLNVNNGMLYVSSSGNVGINTSSPQYDLQVSGTIAATYIDAPARYDLVVNNFTNGTGSIFYSNSTITNNQGSYNPNYNDVNDIVSSYLSYVYVDILDNINTTLYRELTFNTVEDLKVFVNDIGLSSGRIVLYSYKNDIGGLKLGGYNYFITNATFRGRNGKISSKRKLSNRIDTTSRGYTALQTYLTSSFITELSQSISLPLLNEIITTQQIRTLAETGSLSFMRMDKYNKRELSGFYINIAGNDNRTKPSQDVVVNSAGTGFIPNYDIGSQSKLLSTSLLQYDQFNNSFPSQTITTPFWQDPNRKTYKIKVSSNYSFINLYIVQDIVNNGRAIYIEPISIDGIVVPFSSKKYGLNTTHEYFMKRGSSILQILFSRLDPSLNVESLDISTYTGISNFDLENKKSKKQIDIIRLYNDRTCDVFEDSLKIEYSTYNGSINTDGVVSMYFKLNKR